MTAQDTREAEQECKDAGMNDYLAKPVDPDRMAEKILHWTRQQAETSSPAQPGRYLTKMRGYVTLTMLHS